MSNILLLSPYPPYPPYGGGTMRIYQLLRGLAQRHSVTCLSFAPDEAAAEALSVLRGVADIQVVLGPAARSLSRRALTTLASMQPDMALRNQSAAYSVALKQLLQKRSFDIIQAESIEMAPYVLEIARSTLAAPAMLILDQFNVEYVLQKRAALTSLQVATMADVRPATRLRQGAAALYSFAQWFKLKRFERQALRRLPAIVAVSTEDAAMFRGLYPQARIGVVPNGVDTTVFSRVALAGPLEPVLKQPSIVFSGTLDFRANVDAVMWLVERVLPIIRQHYPQLGCVVLGKRPTATLQELARTGVIQLTGQVSDARPYIAEAAVYVVPMRIGGGVRLKLLEALSLETPLVSTSMGAEGIEGLRHAQHCLIADSPEHFAAAIMQLLEQPEYARKLGAAGRDLMLQSYDWTHIVPRLEELYGAEL